MQGCRRTYHPRRQESPEKRSYGNKNPWGAKAEREDRLEQPVVGSDQKTASDYYHEQFIESSFSARYLKWDDNQAWSSQEWKTDISKCDRSKQPVVTSWRKTRESQSSSFHEKTQHDGTAHSVVNEVIPRDRKVQPVVILQRGARPQQFIIGNDETALELSVESQSFLNRVNDQVRKRQIKTIFGECYRRRRKTFCDMVNVRVFNNGSSSIHGEELPGKLPFHREYKRSHIETNVRHIYKIGV